MNPKVLVLGYKHHGKDTFATMLAKHADLEFRSSSEFAFEKAVWPHMHQYATKEDAWANKDKDRTIWFNAISAYNTPDKRRLCKELLEVADIYVGMRSLEEFWSTESLFQYTFWVHDSRKPEEDPSSCQLRLENYKGEVIGNSGTLQQLDEIARLVAAKIRSRFPSHN